MNDGIRSVFFLLFGPILAVTALFFARRLSDRNWRFSLSWLLIATTVVSLLLGLAAYMARE